MPKRREVKRAHLDAIFNTRQHHLNGGFEGVGNAINEARVAYVVLKINARVKRTSLSKSEACGRRDFKNEAFAVVMELSREVVEKGSALAARLD